MAKKPLSYSSPLVHAEELMELENQLAFGSGWETTEIWDAERWWWEKVGKSCRVLPTPWMLCQDTALISHKELVGIAWVLQQKHFAEADCSPTDPVFPWNLLGDCCSQQRFFWACTVIAPTGVGAFSPSNRAEQYLESTFQVTETLILFSSSPWSLQEQQGSHQGGDPRKHKRQELGLWGELNDLFQP